MNNKIKHHMKYALFGTAITMLSFVLIMQGNDNAITNTFVFIGAGIGMWHCGSGMIETIQTDKILKAEKQSNYLSWTDEVSKEKLLKRLKKEEEDYGKALKAGAKGIIERINRQRSDKDTGNEVLEVTIAVFANCIASNQIAIRKLEQEIVMLKLQEKLK